jgi:hypothetical protein
MAIFQHTGVRREAGLPQPTLRLWPFWLVLVVFEAVLWLLLALKFRQPCAPVALAAGLTLGLAVQIGGGRGLRGAGLGLMLILATTGLALYGQAALHVARVLGLDPLAALAGTGPGFAWAVLAGLLEPLDWWLIAAGIVLATALGYAPLRLPARSGTTTRATAAKPL